MPEARYFLAHTRKTPDADIDSWTQTLIGQLTQTGWEAKVVPGRDDFERRAAGLGGWKRWCSDVPCGCSYDGEPLFHGVIVPVTDTETGIGRATALLIKGFLKEGKYTYAWSPVQKLFVPIVGLAELPGDNWKEWATLVLQPAA